MDTTPPHHDKKKETLVFANACFILEDIKYNIFKYFSKLVTAAGNSWTGSPHLCKYTSVIDLIV